MNNLADVLFKENLELILKQDWEVDNRAKWNDGTPVMTKRIFGVVNRYNLKEGLPIISLRPINWKAAIDEILWIWQKRSTNINDLNSHIWDAWAENGHIHNCYGSQLAKKSFGYDSQVDYVLGMIEENPTSRRIMTSMWDTEMNHKKSLLECAFQTQWSVKNSELHMMLYQRSQDFLVANNWNVVQYAALQKIIAQHSSLGVGELIHVIGDCHLYNKHENNAKILLNRQCGSNYDQPELFITPNKGFYDVVLDDFKVLHKNTHREYNPVLDGNTQLKFDVAV